MAKTSSLGGARPGAGRKPVHREGPTVKLSSTVPAALVDQLDAWAGAKGFNRSEAITEAIRRIVRRK